MKVKITPEVLKILQKFEKENYEIYIVGGAIRDILTGKVVYDWDFTTNATPDAILKLFKDAYYTNEFGMVGIPSEEGGERLTEPEGSSPNSKFPRTGGPSRRPYEITTFRTEHGYSDARRPDKVEWGKTLEEDLQRRDFTINAMALKRVKRQESKKIKRTILKAFTLSPSRSFTLTLIDPYGGQKDLDKHLIRAVGDPNERFAEDALRMLRAVRIASELNFKIEKDTKSAIKNNVNLVNKIARERVRDEVLKTLASPHPFQGMELFREVGLMEVILPELEKTFGVEQKSPGRHHIYDVGTHSMRSLKYVSERNQDPIVRLATLIHDVGKPQTYKKLSNGTITFYNHEMVSAKIASRIADRLRFSNKQKEKLYKLVRWHQFSVDERQTDSAIRRFIRRVGKENIADMLDLRVGDRLGGGARETSWRLEEYKRRLIEVQKQPFTVHDLKISGNDIMKLMGIPSGPKIGETLQILFDEVVEKKLENTKKDLLGRLKELKQHYA